MTQPQPHPWTLNTVRGLPWEVIDAEGKLVFSVTPTEDLDQTKANLEFVIAASEGRYCPFCGSITSNKSGACQECLDAEPGILLADPLGNCHRCGEPGNKHIVSTADGAIHCPDTSK